MVPHELIEKLLRIVVENAGARWGLLMLEGESSLVAVAKRAEEAAEFTVTVHEGRRSPLSSSPRPSCATWSEPEA